MITDKTPRKKELKDEYVRSEGMTAIALPPTEPLRQRAKDLEGAMKGEDRRKIQQVCDSIAQIISESFEVETPTIRVLGVRPLEEAGEDFVDEMFGDYDFDSQVIRIWMRTAVLEKMTSYGTLLSTLCHELCHHLDVVLFDMPHTYHTRGFYERAGRLYHHARGTPVRTLVWDRQGDGTYRINWPLTMRGAVLK